MLNDNHLITPKEPKEGECEKCQNLFELRELHEVKFGPNRYVIYCANCKAKFDYLNNESGDE